MVSRFKDLNSPPSGLLDPKWTNIKVDVLQQQNNHQANTKCYRDETLDALADLYKNKCSVCERSRGLELEVDHYRPRKARLNTTQTAYNQPGYYWLTYEWSNLIPLCSKCNGKKSNKFPINGRRISSHHNTLFINPFEPFSFSWLQVIEDTLLINPEYERFPERHFVFRKDGQISGRTLEGDETINVYKLNRKDLRRERLEICQQYAQSISNACSDFSTSGNEAEFFGELKGTFKRIIQGADIDHPYSLYHVFIIRYFGYFIGTRIPTSIRGKVISYFDQFKLSNGI